MASSHSSGLTSPTGAGRRFSADKYPFLEDHKEVIMKKYIIERELPKVGTLERQQLREAASKSNQALRQLAPDIQWVESYVADDKTFCVYLAKDEAVIQQHAELSGFPANKVTEIGKMIDPTTARLG